jgi:hypothetical protein
VSTVVFGPHTTGLEVFGVHIGATTQVTIIDGGTIPKDLTVQLTGLTGEQSTMPVSNGSKCSVSALPGVTVSAIVNNCGAAAAANGSPARFTFQITLRASGTVKISLIPIPVNVQIDAFDVTLAEDTQQHLQLRAAGATSRQGGQQ